MLTTCLLHEQDPQKLQTQWNDTTQEVVKAHSLRSTLVVRLRSFLPIAESKGYERYRKTSKDQPDWPIRIWKEVAHSSSKT